VSFGANAVGAGDRGTILGVLVTLDLEKSSHPSMRGERTRIRSEGALDVSEE